MAPNPQLRELLQGWRTLLGAVFGMGAGIALFGVTFGLFIKPLATSFNWTRGEISFQAVGILGTALSMPVAGRLLDRHRSSTFILIGAIVFAASYLGLAVMNGRFWEYAAIMICIGLAGGPATSPLVVTRPLVTRFTRARGAAIAIGLSGGTLISAAVVPVLQWLITGYGMRYAFAALGLTSMLFGVISFLLFRSVESPAQRPAADAQAPDLGGYSLGEAARTSHLWLIALGTCTTALLDGALTTHLQPLLSDSGFAGGPAALLGTWFAIMVVGSRLGVGLLLDRYWAPGIAAVAVITPLFGCLLLLLPGADVTRAMVAVALLGTASGAQGDLLSFFAARYFGLRNVATIIGAVGLGAALGFAAGASGAGTSFDVFGNYAIVLEIGMALSLISSGAFLMLGLNARAGTLARNA